MAVITTLLVWRIKHSPKGKALAAVREDEVAAAAIGIDTTHHKVISFVIGAFFAGIAGALYAHYDGYLNTNSFGFMRSVELVVMVTLGGLGLVWGAVVAAILLTILPEVLRNFDALMPDWVPGYVITAAAYVADRRMVFYALLLILLMLLRGRRWNFGAWAERIRGLQISRA